MGIGVKMVKISWKSC